MKEVPLHIRGLRVSYRANNGTTVHALDGVSLQIRAGEVVGLLGESGCGKSTLAAATLRLLPPHATYQGVVQFEGRDLFGLSEAELCQVRGERISLIWQDPALALNPVLTVGTQIAEVLRAHCRFSASQRRDRVHELLAEVGFSVPQEIYGAYPHQLSGGQRQRVVIAQAVACRPALVIADEATSKLDTGLQSEILGLLSEIRRRHQTAFLVISHDPGVFSGFADRMVVMYAGRVIEEASAADTFRSPLHPYTQALVRLGTSSVTAAPRLGGRLPAIGGEPPDLTVIHPGCRFEPRCAEKIPVCATCDPQDSIKADRRVSCFKYVD